MKITGLILNIIGVVIVGFQPMSGTYDTIGLPDYPILNRIGWGFLLIGFGLMLFSEIKEKLYEKNR